MKAGFRGQSHQKTGLRNKGGPHLAGRARESWALYEKSGATTLRRLRHRGVPIRSHVPTDPTSIKSKVFETRTNQATIWSQSN